MNGKEYLVFSATVKKAPFGWRGCKRVAYVLMEGCVFMFISFFFSLLLLQSNVHSCRDFDSVINGRGKDTSSPADAL